MRGVLDRPWNIVNNNPEDPTMKNNKSDQVFIGIEVDEKDCESKDEQLDMHKCK